MNGERNYASTAAAMQTAQAPTFTVYTNAEPAPAQIIETAGEPDDRDHAARVVRALHALQEALDSAAVAGLIVEPGFKRYPNRFRELGCDAESYVARVEIYRKLA